MPRFRQSALFRKFLLLILCAGLAMVPAANAADPVAGPGEVVLDVVAASVNAADWKVRLGEYKQTSFPLILGRVC